MQAVEWKVIRFKRRTLARSTKEWLWLVSSVILRFGVRRVAKLAGIGDLQSAISEFVRIESEEAAEVWRRVCFRARISWGVPPLGFKSLPGRARRASLKNQSRSICVRGWGREKEKEKEGEWRTRLHNRAGKVLA